jgi:hypothetical protein
MVGALVLMNLEGEDERNFMGLCLCLLVREGGGGIIFIAQMAVEEVRG